MDINKGKPAGLLVGFIVVLLLGLLLWQDTLQVRATEAPTLTDEITEKPVVTATKTPRRGWIATGTALQSRWQTRTAVVNASAVAVDGLPITETAIPFATPSYTLLAIDAAGAPPTPAAAPETPVPGPENPVGQAETDKTPVVPAAASTAAPIEVSLMNGDFESGPQVGWTEDSRLKVQIIYNTLGLPTDIYPHGGSWIAWLGGIHNEQTSLLQEVTIPPQAPMLSYWHWIESEDSCDYDYARVLINDSDVQTYSLCTQSNTSGWTKKRVNLSTFAGQTVQLKFQVDTDSADSSSLYVDDVTFEIASTDLYLPALFKRQNNNSLALSR